MWLLPSILYPEGAQTSSHAQAALEAIDPALLQEAKRLSVPDGRSITATNEGEGRCILPVMLLLDLVSALRGAGELERVLNYLHNPQCRRQLCCKRCVDAHASQE